MKIAHIFWGLGFGGIETMLVNIANAQVDYGADVHLVLINELYEKTLLDRLSSNVHIHLLNRKLGSKGLGFIWKLNKELRIINPDKIHLHGPEFYAMIFGRRLSHVVSLTLHALPVQPVRHRSCWRALVARLTFGFKYGEDLVTQIPQLFAISSSVKEAFYAKYNVDSMIVYNGILTSNFSRKVSYNITPPIFRVIQISRLDHQKKGQDLLIKAASILKGKLDVTFIGDGDSMAYLKELSQKLEVNDYVHFLGKKTQGYIAEHLKGYSLFIQPSRREGFGLTVAEAMAAKVPVLVSSGQGPAEVTENIKYGWVFLNGDENDLASQIIYLISHYEDAERKANLAYDYVCSHYDVSITARSYLELY